MNKIINKIKTPKLKKFESGDIFERSGQLYILAITGYEDGKILYETISLIDGNRWTDATDIESAVADMTFVGRDLTITVS